MAKKIEWLDQFADDQYSKMTKTASQKKIANQIIVDCSTYPNAKVGTLVDYDNTKYKIVDTKYRDKSGPGLLLEEVTACGGNCGPVATGEIQTNNGIVPATTEVKNPPTQKTAAKKDFDLDFDALADFDDSKFDDDSDFGADSDLGTDTDFAASAEPAKLSGNTGASEYPDIIPRPGGAKPIASEDIEGPGKKRVTDAPYHPTYDPGEQYALESKDEWQDAADRTAAAIKQEDEQDRTTVEGHYTWNQYIDAILDDNPSEALMMTDAELPDVEESDTDLSDTGTDTDEDLDLEDTEDLDFADGADAGTEDSDIDFDVPDTEDSGDDVDSAVDSMLDFDEEDSADADLPVDDDSSMTDDFSASDEDLDLPDIDDTSDDIPEDFASEDFDANDNDDDFSAEDLDLPDEEEESKMASYQSKTKQLSRLAFKN